jgi:hypothetical protein
MEQIRLFLEKVNAFETTGGNDPQLMAGLSNCLQSLGNTQLSTALLHELHEDGSIARLLTALHNLVREPERHGIHEVDAVLALNTFCSDIVLRDQLLEVAHSHPVPLSELISKKIVGCSDSSDLRHYLFFLSNLVFRVNLGCTALQPLQLIPFLIDKINDKDALTLGPCLAAMSSCIRSNMAMKIHVRQQDSVTPLYHTLLTFLGHHDVKMIVYALSILSRLATSDPLGDKLFNQNNLDQTFQLVFNLVCEAGGDQNLNGEQLQLQHMCVDLLSDLLASSPIVLALENFAELDSYIAKALEIAVSDATPCAQSQLELLELLTRTSMKIKRTICNMLTANDGARVIAILRRVNHKHTPSACAAAKFMVAQCDENSTTLKYIIQRSSAEAACASTEHTFSADVTTADITMAGNDSQMMDVGTPARGVEFMVGGDDPQSAGVALAAAFTRAIGEPLRSCFRCLELALNRGRSLGSCSRSRATEVARLLMALTSASESLPVPRALSAELPVADTLKMVRSEAEALVNGGTDTELGLLLLRFVANLSTSDGHDGMFESLLQEKGVVVLIGTALRQGEKKQLVQSAMVLVHQIMKQSHGPNLELLSIVDGLFSLNQRSGCALDERTAKIQQLVLSTDMGKRMALKNKEELKHMHEKAIVTAKLHEDETAQLRREAQVQADKYQQQVGQIKPAFEQRIVSLTTDNQDLQALLEMKMAEVERAEQSALQHKMRGCGLEDETAESRRKVKILEIRLEEIAESASMYHKAHQECEERVREKEFEFEKLAIALGESELLSQSTIAQLEHCQGQLKEQTARLEETYQKLILLAKAHQTKTHEHEGVLQKLDDVNLTAEGLQSTVERLQTKLQAKGDECGDRDQQIEESRRVIASREHEAREQQRRYEAQREEFEELQKELKQRQISGQSKDDEIAALKRTIADAEREKAEQADALSKQEEELSKNAALAQLINQLTGAKGPLDAKSILGQQDLNASSAR